VTKHPNPAKQNKIDKVYKKDLPEAADVEDMMTDLQGELLETHIDEAIVTKGHTKVK
jgi:hypothetical protein